MSVPTDEEVMTVQIPVCFCFVINCTLRVWLSVLVNYFKRFGHKNMFLCRVKLLIRPDISNLFLVFSLNLKARPDILSGKGLIYF